MLRRAVSCFLSQTYQPRELVIVYQSDDAATKEYVTNLGHDSIRALEIPPSPQLGPGSLRNIAMQAAHGQYVAVWDDDDWYGPLRLAEQMRAIAAGGRAGCLLPRLMLYDCVTQSAFLSQDRNWENTLVALRSAVPPYSDARRGSDTEVVYRMAEEGKLVRLERSDLYIYVFHGGNVWDREHWEKNLLAHAQPMTRAESQRVRATLGE
jgi:glycosyltransferase involved in cell wall biosynthesis